MKFIIVSVCYGFLFIVVELLAKRLHPPDEATRKLSHILAGVGASLLPFVLSFAEIALLGALFVPAVYVSMKSNIFRSVHAVRRTTYGELYFPLAISACAILFPDKLLFIYGILVIGVSDALASLLGRRYGRKQFRTPEGSKSYVGSSVFFASTFIIGFSLILSFTNASFLSDALWSLLLAVSLTVIEARASRGLDNLFVPVSASGLLGFLVATGLLGN